jgi:uncharacterized protein YhbP (UPF0306 family)
LIFGKTQTQTLGTLDSEIANVQFIRGKIIKYIDNIKNDTAEKEKKTKFTVKLINAAKCWIARDLQLTLTQTVFELGTYLFEGD